MNELRRKEAERFTQTKSIGDIIKGLGVVIETPESLADHIKKRLEEFPLDKQISILRSVESVIKTEVQNQIETKSKELYYLEQQYNRFI